VCVIFLETHSTQVEFAMGCRDFNRPTRPLKYLFNCDYNISVMPKHILLIDDDALLVKALAFTLQQNGYRATTATSAEQGFALLQRDAPDLILLDIGLPGMDGLEALKRIEREKQIPVIFLTARRRELDEVLGLELGAQDYITKPFNEDVLLARIKAVLRRNERGDDSTRVASEIVCGDIVIDVSAHEVKLRGAMIDLAPKAFELLRVLAVNAGQVMSVDQLIEQVWGIEFAGEPQVVYVHIRWLREKLEDEPSNPKRLVTVRGVGYKLVA
jgi:DNA-binding response OmpR family regulator